ncbi:MAG TPA: 2-oxoglutarate dehydrogenase E1 component [Oligoflexia bacterium]|mgnify:CR=1 FL=1|nr:2-oxoglutarate dehydrogenase E1 component [Oligoflexia bacterium]
MKQTAQYLKSQNADYIEELYARYLENPHSVDESWQYFFDGLVMGEGAAKDDAEEHLSNGKSNGHANGNGGASGPQLVATAAPVTPLSSALSHEAKVAELIQAYRELGRLLADTNPLESPTKSHELLDLKKFELSEADLERKFTAARLLGFTQPATLREILAMLHETYCGKIGVEYTHIEDPGSRHWLEDRMEKVRNRPQFDGAIKKQILKKLTEAECFERYLHTRFVAQKRFSVEGGDAIIPMLDRLAVRASALGASDMVMGMAHRGRLNVLTNIFGKKYEDIFTEFEGTYQVDTSLGEGDVKYHMGYSADMQTPSGVIHLSLASNPSHLEFVNPVVEGMARAKQTMKQDVAREKVVPVLIHGDAAFAGQGVVYETLQLSQLAGYATGGTIHFVINNQVGFTTSPCDARSTTYSTDLAKMLESPIFHVNGDDAEACVYVTELAMDYRQKFHKDVVIDLICYRKYGHNEGDEPGFTQPAMYRKIKDHRSPRETYAAELAARGDLSAADADMIVQQINGLLTEAHARAKSAAKAPHVSVFEGAWKGLKRASDEDIWVRTQTAVKETTLKEIGKKMTEVPADFEVHPKLVRLLETRAKSVETGQNIDWGTGELLAYGSLLVEGRSIRLSGQDCERGTFSHRHSVFANYSKDGKYSPLNHLKSGQGRFEVYNSNLSETGVLGFEYGYSIADPSVLTIWEAQFGDFANGAQVIIDQFIASSEMKWQRMSGVTLLLPHGYEGQGPEHSSARLERFLQLCAKNNMQVCNLTTPAQIFHALRRQLLRDFRKPLVVMSPKSLLRHPEAVSKLADFTSAGFSEVIADSGADAERVGRVLFCSGKVFYDLQAARKTKGRSDVAIVRVEQLYPWPTKQIESELKKYPNAKEVMWVQEEPRNMGAWLFVRDYLENNLVAGQRLSYVGRGASAAPAVGSAKVHEKEQKALIEAALA